MEKELGLGPFYVIPKPLKALMDVSVPFMHTCWRVVSDKHINQGKVLHNPAHIILLAEKIALLFVFPASIEATEAYPLEFNEIEMKVMDFFGKLFR